MQYFEWSGYSTFPGEINNTAKITFGCIYTEDKNVTSSFPNIFFIDRSV